MIFRRIQILRITTVYLAFGFAWILISDMLLEHFSSSHQIFSTIQSIKGIIFVLLSALVIATLLWQESRVKTVLLSEIHHRVKNNLAIISAFLELQKDSLGQGKNPSSQEYVLLNSIRRIKTMAIAHEILYNLGSFQKLDAKQLIERIWDYCLASEPNHLEETNTIPIKLELDIAVDNLDLKPGIPVALILNELFSNSLEHGFPKEILVPGFYPRIQLFLGSEDGNCLIQYKDNGVGLQDKRVFHKESKKGLGFFIIKTLTKQLNGEIVLQAREKGIEFFIKFPQNTI